MVRELKMTTIQGSIYLYPVPVKKELKYLIRCESQEEAAQLIQSISDLKLSHPDVSDTDFEIVALHTDQQTKILAPKS